MGLQEATAVLPVIRLDFATLPYALSRRCEAYVFTTTAVSRRHCRLVLQLAFWGQHLLVAGFSPVA